MRIPVWVKLPFLSIEFWKVENFRVIGDKMGIFLKIYIVVMNSSNCEVTKSSVETYLIEGLL
jgi:hypothetical protein